MDGDDAYAGVPLDYLFELFLAGLQDLLPQRLYGPASFRSYGELLLRRGEYTEAAYYDEVVYNVGVDTVRASPDEPVLEGQHLAADGLLGLALPMGTRVILAHEPPLLCRMHQRQRAGDASHLQQLEGLQRRLRPLIIPNTARSGVRRPHRLASHSSDHFGSPEEGAVLPEPSRSTRSALFLLRLRG